MNYSELSYRYATALFLSATDQAEQHAYLTALNELAKGFFSDVEARQFVETPLIRSEAKEEVLKAVFKQIKVPAVIADFVNLLASKGRLPLLKEIASAYQAKIDQVDHVERGHVRSATPLNDKQKIEIQDAIEKYCHAKVVLDFADDDSLLGGLTAQVGSLTFDDSLSSHLNHIKEELTRSVR